MRLALTGTVLAAAAAGLSATPADAQSIDLRHIAARVTIVPQDRQDVQVVILKTNPRMPLRVSHFGGATVVGNANWMSWFWSGGPSCVRQDGERVPHVLSGVIAYDDLPQIVVLTPMDAKVAASGAIYGVVGHADSLKLLSAGCGQWTVANVKNTDEVSSAGWSVIRGGRSGALKIHIAGAGDVTEQGADNGLDIDIAGSGRVRVGQGSGPVNIHIAGGGDIGVNGGHATALTANIAGSGQIRYSGVADTLDAGIAGSGRIDVAKVTGEVKRHIAGSGDINVGP